MKLSLFHYHHHHQCQYYARVRIHKSWRGKRIQKRTSNVYCFVSPLILCYFSILSLLLVNSIIYLCMCLCVGVGWLVGGRRINIRINYFILSYIMYAKVYIYECVSVCLELEMEYEYMEKRGMCRTRKLSRRLSQCYLGHLYFI